MQTTKDQIAPTLHRAQDAIREAALIAREKSIEAIESDAAHEARRRGRNVVRAARGAEVVPARRRWPFVLGLLGLGAAAGAGVAYAFGRVTAALPPTPGFPADPSLGPKDAATDEGSVDLTTAAQATRR